MAVDLNRFERVHHAMGRPLLVVTGGKGTLCCGYLSLESLERNGDAAAIVRGVENHDEMLSATVQAVTTKAKALGVKEGMTGEEALTLFQ